MNTDQARIRILTVDDHPIVREGIAGLIATQTDMVVVGEATDGRDAIQQFRTHRPDVTLMDLQMPDMNGIDALIALRNEFPDAKILLLTTYKGDTQIVRALKAGAQGYLLKNALHRELLEAIRAAYSGKKTLSGEARVYRRIGTDSVAISQSGQSEARPKDFRGRRCSCLWVLAGFSPQPFGTGPFFPGSLSFVANRHPVCVAPLSSIREKMAPVASHPYMSIHPTQSLFASLALRRAGQARSRQ